MINYRLLFKPCLDQAFRLIRWLKFKATCHVLPTFVFPPRLPSTQDPDAVFPWRRPAEHCMVWFDEYSVLCLSIGIWTSDFDLTISDRRLKKNITPLTQQLGEPSQIVSRLRPVSFEMIGDSGERMRFGFIAQEVERVLPSLVMSPDGIEDASATKAVLYQDIIAILTLAVQHQAVCIVPLYSHLFE